MKKRLSAVFLAIALCLSLAACSGSSSESKESAPVAAASSSAVVSAAENAETTEETEAKDTTTEEEPVKEESPSVMEGEGDVGKYHVVINGAKKDKDYEGNPVIIISYTWTNNSEETTSPMGSMMTEAFQDGVSMDMGIMDREYNDGTKDVRPGTSIEVDAVYNLTSDSTVEFEISAIEDMFLSPTPVVTKNFEPSELD